MKLLTIIETVSHRQARVIDAIMEFHPGYGTEKGYSWYIGGMKDTGAWYLDKLIKEDVEVLEFLLKDLQKIEADGRKQREENEMLRIQMGDEAYREMRHKQEQEAWKKLGQEMEAMLMWGIKPKDK